MVRCSGRALAALAQMSVLQPLLAYFSTVRTHDADVFNGLSLAQNAAVGACVLDHYEVEIRASVCPRARWYAMTRVCNRQGWACP